MTDLSSAAPDARSLLRTAGPQAALAQLKQEVRRAPRDARLRIFLFQLFCVTAEWDRALTQLSVAAELDPLALPMAQAYRAAIRCEMLRERVFAGTRSPTLMGEPAEWMSLLVEANRVLATGAVAEAASLRDAAFAQAPASAGTFTVEGSKEKLPFEWIADADQRLGPMLEAMVEGKYYWVPFTRLASLVIEPPADVRDHVWMPAHFTWSSGGESAGFIPTRYPGSAGAHEELAYSRRTEWQSDGEWEIGLGQRMLATDAADIPLMDLRRLDLSAASSG